MIESNDSQFGRGFGSDNHSGIHPKILAAIASVNRDHAHAYGMDPVSERCREAFSRHFGANATPFFIFNGTAANVLALRGLIEPYHSVLCADSSHLNVDECAAPEFILGCKLIPVASQGGKISPEALEPHIQRLGDQHAAQPRLVSIAQPTEVGTVYSLSELQRLAEFTRKNNLLFHMDGARLANAALHLGCDLKSLTAEIGIDALSFGGTKNGLLGAEAVVFFNSARTENFKFMQKQSMQLPSKMRFIAAQFLTYLEDGLWSEIARHSCAMAKALEQRLREVPEIEIAYPVQSNAVFARIPKAWTKALKQSCFFYVWDEREWVVRLMMGFDSTLEDIERFMRAIADCRLRAPVVRK